MKEALKDILSGEAKKINDLLALMEEQHKCIMENDIFALDAIVEKIQLCNKEVAEFEVKRRKLVGHNSMGKFMYNNYNED